MEKKEYTKPCVEEVELEETVLMAAWSREHTGAAKEFDGVDADFGEEEE